MGLPGQDSTPNRKRGRDIVLGEARPGRKRKQHRTEPNLEIADNIFSDKALIALVDEWLVPTIVDEFIRDMMNSVVEDMR